MNILKRLFCRHYKYKHTFIENFYGDKIHLAHGMRSMWKCNHCGKFILNPFLFHEDDKNG